MTGIRQMFANWLDPSQTEIAEKAEAENKLAQQQLREADKNSEAYKIASLRATEAATKLTQEFAKLATQVNVNNLDDFKDEYEAYIKAQKEIDDEQVRKVEEAKEAQKKIDDEQNEILESIDNELEEVEEALENVETIIDEVEKTNKNQDWVDNIIAITVDKKFKQLQEVIEQQDYKINELRLVLNSVITRVSQVSQVKKVEEAKKITWDSQLVHDAIKYTTDINGFNPVDIKKETRKSISSELSELSDNISEAIYVNKSRQ